jgi:hypothetical protein
MIASLRAVATRSEGRAKDLADARDAATAEVAVLRKAVDTAASELKEARRDVVEAEAQAAARLDASNQSDALAEAARAEATAGDARCAATGKALAAVTNELDESRAAFEKEQEAHIKVELQQKANQDT